MAGRSRFSTVGERIHAAFDQAGEHLAPFEDTIGVHNQHDFDDATAADLASLQRDGFVILRSVLSVAEVEKLRSALAPHLLHLGRNNFEGTKTKRVYGLLGRDRTFIDTAPTASTDSGEPTSPSTFAAGGNDSSGALNSSHSPSPSSLQLRSTSPFDAIAMHPRVLDLVDAALAHDSGRRYLKNCLLTAFQAIQILPGETPQPLHYDDSFCHIRRPHPPLSVAVIWALDPFTADNGATVVFPGSHKWGHTELPSANKSDAVPCVMPAGSAVVFLSTLWHGGGANTTADQQRLALTAQYCQPWIRPQESMQLLVPPDHVLHMEPRLQSLLGYDIHPPFVGHVDGQHPLKRAAALAAARPSMTTSSLRSSTAGLSTTASGAVPSEISAGALLQTLPTQLNQAKQRPTSAL